MTCASLWSILYLNRDSWVNNSYRTVSQRNSVIAGVDTVRCHDINTLCGRLMFLTEMIQTDLFIPSLSRVGSRKAPSHRLERQQQTNFFRLRTGNCHLLRHMCRLGLALTEDCMPMPDRTTVPRACSTAMPPLQTTKTGPQSPEHVLQFFPLFREARQDHSPQSMFYRVLSPLQRIKTRPQFPEHVLQSSVPSSENQNKTTVTRACSTEFCPLFREARQDHSHQSMFYSYFPSSEKQGRTTVPRACSTEFCPLFRESKQDHSHQSKFYRVLSPLQKNQNKTTVTRACSTEFCPLFKKSKQDHNHQSMFYRVLSPLQRIKTRPQSPEHVLQLCPLFSEARQNHSPRNTFYSSAPSSKTQQSSRGATLQEFICQHWKTFRRPQPSSESPD